VEKGRERSDLVGAVAMPGAWRCDKTARGLFSQRAVVIKKRNCRRALPAEPIAFFLPFRFFFLFLFPPPPPPHPHPSTYLPASRGK